MRFGTLAVTTSFLAMVGAMAPAASIPGGYGALVVFGDSLSDTGRVKETIDQVTGGRIDYPPAPYADGRFSNGDIYVDVLADSWGLTSDLDLMNYAFGGARATTRLDEVLDFGEQVREYRNAGAPQAENALAIVNFGGNDAIVAAYAAGGHGVDGTVGIAGDGSDPAAVEAARKSARQAGRKAANAARRQMESLGALGMDAFVVLNLADVGTTPRFADPNLIGTNPLTGESNAEYATLATNAYNKRLAVNAETLRGQGLEVFEVDVHGLFEDAALDPDAYGITDLGACGVYDSTNALGLNFYDFSSDICDESNPESITAAFWDDVHPTSLVHGHLADAVEDSLSSGAVPALSTSLSPLSTTGPAPVPLPLPAALLGGALLALASVRRGGSAPS